MPLFAMKILRCGVHIASLGLACMVFFSCSDKQEKKEDLDKAVDWLANYYFNAASISEAPPGGEFLRECEKVLNGETRITDYPFLKELLESHWNWCYSRRVDKSVIKAFAQAGADVNIKIYESEAIAVAVEQNDAEIAEILLSHGANPNARCVLRSCLMEAIDKRNEQMAALLIRNGANIHEKKYSGDTLVVAALENGCMNTAKLLLEKGCPPDPDALALAISNKDFELVKLLVDKGVDVNKEGSAGYRQRSPLQRALEKGQTDIAEYLISKGADVNWKDCMGESLASDFFRHGDTQMAQFLVDHGADVDSRDAFGDTLLISAIHADNTQFVRYLVEKGANVNATNHFSDYALDIAERKKNQQIVELLVSKGAHREPREENTSRMRQTSSIYEAADSLSSNKKSDEDDMDDDFNAFDVELDEDDADYEVDLD